MLREEFRTAKLTFHSDLRRRAASRRALSRTSSCCCRAKRNGAQYCQGKLTVRPSVTLRYHGHIGWNSAKIISRLISLTLCRPQHDRCTPKGTPQILAGIGVGIGKRFKIESKLLLTDYKNMYTRFWLVPKSMTLTDLWAGYGAPPQTTLPRGGTKTAKCLGHHDILIRPWLLLLRHWQWNNFENRLINW